MGITIINKKLFRFASVPLFVIRLFSSRPALSSCSRDDLSRGDSGRLNSAEVLYPPVYLRVCGVASNKRHT